MRTTALVLILLCSCVLVHLGSMEMERRYLASSIKRSTAVLLTVSGLKAAVAILEGSEASGGVSFFGKMEVSLELGDAFQPIYDAVDILWRGLIISLVVQTTMWMILVIVPVLGPWTLAATIVCWSLYFVSKHRAFREPAAMATSLAVAIYVVIPLAVTSCSVLSSHLVGPMVERVGVEIAGVTQEVKQLQGEVEPGGLSFLWNVRAKVRKAMALMAQKARTISRRLFKQVVLMVASFVLDCLVLPLTMLMIGYRMMLRLYRTLI